MRLSDFIRASSGAIIGEWESFARTLVSTDEDSSPLALRDHIDKILIFIADDLESPQTDSEQIKKSHGEGPKDTREQGYSAAEIHASLRLDGGFNMDQMVSEYRALRASVIKLWSAQSSEMNGTDMLDVTRFNEAVDQAMSESISHYTKRLDHSKDLFLAILGHDIRNPLGAVLGSAELMLKIGTLNERQRMLITQITESGWRINEIVANLLDLTRARFGAGLPVIAVPMDFKFVSQQMVEEMRAAYPKREIELEIMGDTEGNWDKARIAQVFSNLIGNAIQYSFQNTTIKVSVKGDAQDVTLSVHNQGIPIPAEKVRRIFDSLTRGTIEDGQEETESTNLGLGLFITKEIVTAHGGKIGVTSSEKDGTTFSASFPKAA